MILQTTDTTFTSGGGGDDGGCQTPDHSSGHITEYL